MDTHSALPWEEFTEPRFSGWYAIRQKDGDEIGSGDGGLFREDAAFIVRAVNSHAALMDALTLLSEKVVAAGGKFILEDELKHAAAALTAARA